MNSVCRCCLSVKTPLTQMDDNFRSDYFLLTNIQVKLMDGLPQDRCMKCAEIVASFIQFREKCLQSESCLQQGLENKTIVKVKNEVEIFQENQDINEDFTYSTEEESVDCANVEVKVEKDEIIDEPLVRRLRKRTCSITKGGLIVPDVAVVKKSVNKTQKHDNSQQIKENKETFIFNLDVLGCGICMTSFKKGEDEELKLHLESHSQNTECEICFEGFAEWPQLISHRIDHLPRKQKICYICKEKYAGVYEMEYHYRQKHTDDLDKEVKCKFCMKKYKTAKSLKKHVQRHQRGTSICPICNKRVVNLGQHILTHSEEKKYLCKLCPYASKTYGALSYHTAKNHVKISCKKCRKLFNSSELYDVHECSIKLFICTVCGKEVQMKRRTLHMKMHDTVAHYKCKLCPAVYRRKNNLNAHMDRHNKKPRHECEFCKRKFYDRGCLIKHRRIHTGEKPYVCKICSKGFTATHNLKVHMKVHGLDLVVKRAKPGEHTTDEHSE